MNGEVILPFAPAKASKAAAEQVVGRELPDELFDMDQVWGRRILVVCESPEAMYGHIVIPKHLRDREPKTTGWVTAAGPWVGTPAPGSNGWSPFTPQELLLKRVLFSAYVGHELPVAKDPGKLSNKEFAEWVESEGGGDRVLARPYLIMTDLDIFWSY